MDKESENKPGYANRLLRLVLDVAEGMLCTGAEVSRVEDTVERILRAYGGVEVQIFSITSVIDGAVRMPDGEYSEQIRRVKHTENDLGRLEKYNALSRYLCASTPDLDEFEKHLDEIKTTKAYPTWVMAMAAAVVTSSFCLFFGGGLLDAIISAIAGVVVFGVSALPSKRLNSMAKTIISAMLATLIAELSVRMGIGGNSGAIIIGAIMLLVPGLAFGTAIKDLLCGDLIAGSLKTLQACLMAIMIAFGYVVGMGILGGV